eukprot:TRINITY_DN2819_c0_g1_i1.p1 TRINITY_DN2819_c0_g1~~TRINITY_DN2819_c0_g1_i1.p1  ORF type:complete len:108 (-),score=25.42 TRINITY_DN2819_c0_g1_i1:60-383(-)
MCIRDRGFWCTRRCMLGVSLTAAATQALSLPGTLSSPHGLLPTLSTSPTASGWQPSLCAPSLEASATCTQPPSNRDGRANSQGHCLLYTSDAADDLLCVDLGGRRII